MDPQAAAVDDEATSQTASTLPSGATTPALPQLHFPERVQAALENKRRSLSGAGTGAGAGSSNGVGHADGADTNAAAQEAMSSDDAVIIGIAVVDFNHLVGPQVEYAHPKELSDDEELCASLPFLALPDGSHLVSVESLFHCRCRTPQNIVLLPRSDMPPTSPFFRQSDEDFCYFHLISNALHTKTIFGISCNRQIASDKLNVRGKEVTRSTVQKAVVVLARDVSRLLRHKRRSTLMQHSRKLMLFPSRVLFPYSLYLARSRKSSASSRALSLRRETLATLISSSNSTLPSKQGLGLHEVHARQS